MSQVSIVIPIYNSEKTLSRCLNSVQTQTFTDFEVLMINDGSTDNSVEICEEYCKADARFKLINQNNAGPSAARNRGIEESTSKYLSFVDSDDWIEPDYLEKFYNAAEETNADITVCSFIIDYPDRSVMLKSSHSKPGLYVGEDCKRIAIDSIDSEITGIVIYSWIRFVKREVLQNSGFRFDINIGRGEDFLLWTQLSFKINSLCLITDKHLYHYVMNENSITHKYVKDYFDMIKIIYNEFRKTLPEEEEIIKKTKYAFIQRTYTALNISAHADNKEIFLNDFNKIVKDELLRGIVKSLRMSEVPERFRKNLGILKFRLYWVLKLLYLIKLYKFKKSS